MTDSRTLNIPKPLLLLYSPCNWLISISLRRIKRKDGRQVYHLDIRVPDLAQPGRTVRIIRSLRTTERAEAQRRYHALAAELTANTPPLDRTWTLQNLRDRVIAHLSLSRASSTLKDYRGAFRSLSLSIPFDTPIGALTRAQVDSWRLHAIQNQGNSQLINYPFTTHFEE